MLWFNTKLEYEMNNVVDTKAQAMALEQAYIGLISNAKPKILIAIARGHGIGAHCWSKPVEVFLTTGSWDETDFEHDKVDLYLQTLMSTLPLDDAGVYLDLEHTKWWLKQLGVNDVNLNFICPRFSKKRKDRAIERQLLSSPHVLEALRALLMEQVPDAVEDIEDALEHYQCLPSRFEDDCPLDADRPCLF
jgi:hypothetical protein